MVSHLYPIKMKINQSGPYLRPRINHIQFSTNLGITRPGNFWNFFQFPVMKQRWFKYNLKVPSIWFKTKVKEFRVFVWKFGPRFKLNMVLNCKRNKNLLWFQTKTKLVEYWGVDFGPKTLIFGCHNFYCYCCWTSPWFQWNWFKFGTNTHPFLFTIMNGVCSEMVSYFHPKTH